MEKVRKYKVINPKSPHFGKTIKAIPNGQYWYIDVKTGCQYEECELREIPEKHAAYFGIHIFRFGIFLFVREYIKYHSYQFGCGVDYIDGTDRYIDFEIRVLCFGVGLRLTILKR